MTAQLTAIASDSNNPLPSIAIPPQPDLLAKLVKANSNTEKFITLIVEDANLREGVLKVVNSQSLGVSRTVEKVEQAVVLLGVDCVMNIVYAVLLHESLGIDNDDKLKAFWRNSQATAAAAGMLANELTGVKPEDAYLLGLFRDCAIPLIYQKFPHYFSVLDNAYKDRAARIISIEDQQINANHAVVGHLIARAWNLPKPIVQAIHDHHNHRRLLCRGNNQVEVYVDCLCATLKLAEHITHTPLVYTNSAKNFEWGVYKKPILKLIDKSPEEILDVANAIVPALQETDDLL